MLKFKLCANYFSKSELFLWEISVLLILLSFAFFDRENYLTLTASLVGVTSLIFNAKGHPLGQLLMIIFSLLYGIISFTFSYYGEMLTYLCMTMPMAIFALISWLKNPYEKGSYEVRVNSISHKEGVLLLAAALLITIPFYFLLCHFHTANIIPSTISVATSFLAVYLTFRRSALFALAYAANDSILILLWTLAGMSDTRYFSVVVCFTAFLFNDIYGFINWLRLKRKQTHT